ncbi:cysteine-rich receptor-like protein kinase 8 [Tanacetum coccineum]
MSSYSTQSNYRQNMTNGDSGNNRGESSNMRSTFKQGVYCGNCQKEGHYKSECYQLVGYPVGHPLHGKFRPPNNSNNNRTNTTRPRTVNMAVGTDGPSSSGKEHTEDTAVIAKMDNLQNQINQVMMMLQNTQGICDPKAFAAGRYLFIASCIAHIKDAWVCDSGATDHICITLSLMFNIQKCTTPITVSLPNGHQTMVTITGSVKLKPQLVLHNVFYIPSFAYNLLSISQVTKTTALSVLFNHSTCIFQGNNQKIAHGTQFDGLYIITPDSTPTFTKPFSSVNTISKTSHLWHLRLGHPSVNVQKQIKSLSRIPSYVNNFQCNICPLAKQTALPFPSSTFHAKQKFDLVHADTWGPYKHSTINKCTYFLTLVDDFSRITWTYLLPSKSHVTSTIKTFIHYANTQFNTKVKILRSDNGTEFTNHSLREFLDNKGILHQTSCPNTPQQNGRAERKHKHLLQVARSLHFQAKFPIHLWGYSLLAATYLINRLPSPILNNKSPFETLFNTPPDLTNLKTIGCLAYASIHTSNKFAPRAIPSIFLGYPQNQKGYLLLSQETNKVFVSRHVTFHEDIFPYHTPTTSTDTTTPQSVSNSTFFPQPIPSPTVIPPTSEPNPEDTEHNQTHHDNNSEETEHNQFNHENNP